MTTYEVFCLAVACVYGMFVVIGLIEIIKKRFHR
jgi:hypothetical protein